jgi:hypothetical protein
LPAPFSPSSVADTFHAHQIIPRAITVENANILSRQRRTVFASGRTLGSH